MFDDLFGGQRPIEIDVHFKIEKNKSGVARVTVLEDNVAATMKADEKQRDKVTTLRTQWSQLTWQAANDLLRRSMRYSHKAGENELDWVAYRSARLVSCLQGWDAKNAEGIATPCNEFTINQLNSAVALALLEKFDKVTAVDPEVKEKN